MPDFGYEPNVDAMPGEEEPGQSGFSLGPDQAMALAHRLLELASPLLPVNE